MSEYRQNLDQLDQALIAQLRVDGRASVAKLSDILGVSRGTVQNRLDKLLESGAVLGFTIRVNSDVDQDLVKAVMMVSVSGRSTTPVVQRLRGIPNVLKIHTTNGAWDLVLDIQASSLAEFDSVLHKVRDISGVLNSETSILLNSL
ncbi:Lrp/AsnC family transcriptional regulator [Planctobacterium marinum]|uniref:AsnC family transcriptional regulator n=1 Tax=Planctobacterium marinum TaxID=1631968 RepID=A0AA48HJQ6_9ALTE|nr:AsnC family transcriptional regulator [Planctobacterium marinum]